MPDNRDQAKRHPAYTITPVSGSVPSGTAVIAVEGEADLVAAAEFRRCVEAALGSSASVLVVDAAELEFMDSSMLKELLRARSDVGRVVLAGLGGAPRRLLQLTRTHGLFEHADDRDSAFEVAANP